jgi:hypothetical protein
MASYDGHTNSLMRDGRTVFTLEDAHRVERTTARHSAEALRDEEVTDYLLFRSGYKGAPDPILAELVARFREAKGMDV